MDHRLMLVCPLFYLHLLLLYSCASATLCSHDQSSALLQFKQLFSFINVSYFDCDFYIKLLDLEIEIPPYCDGRCPPYSKTMSWKEDIDCCSWDGVTCDPLTGHVIDLDLSCGWLHGSIPSNTSLFLLSHLQTLNLAFNNFNYSQISSDFTRFPSLTQLNLSNSNFNGHIPSEISHLSKLVSLDLSSPNYMLGYYGANNLTLETPVLKGLVQNLTKLTQLFLDYVDMSKIMPSSFTNLSSSLTSLSLNRCGLQGNFPDNIFHLPDLQILSLASNTNLTGNLPKANWSIPLKILEVSEMSLSGEFPDSINELVSLQHLGLENCNLNGLVPASLGNLTQLTYLSLSSNKFTGNIPSFLSNLQQLRYLDFSSNCFFGEFPDIFVNLTQLSILDLGENQLVGQIPSHISGLQNLVAIVLDGNYLTGTIPSWLFTLPSLKLVSLSNNKLSWPIDDFQSNSLQWIALTNNSLQGSIPSSIFDLVNLTLLVLSSNNLSVILEPYMFAKLKKLEKLDLSNNPQILVSSTFEANSSFSKLQHLSLSACNLSEVPEFFLRNSDRLEYLDLSNNKIEGRIPNWMYDVGKDTLYWLNISHNFITNIGYLPWKNLEFLDLRFNLLEGPLPIPPRDLTLFFLSNNKFTGEIPYSLCSMTSIQFLDFSNNTLSGTIPECMGNISSLHVLDLRKNKFYGTIPRMFAKGNHFRTLNFNDNELEGPVSHSLVNCVMLEVLDLGNNKIIDTFPYWLESLPELRVLVLRSNKFYGSISSSSKVKDLFPNLRIFDLSNNNFNSSLPAKYFQSLNAMMSIDDIDKELRYMGEDYYQDSVTVTLKGFEIELAKIITIFTTIDFSNNNFSGEIPKIIGKLHALRLLNLSHNNLIGCIPSELENLHALETLDLSSNKLVGRIPWQLIRLNFLQVINFSENQLEGPIPRDNHFDTFSNTSYAGNLGLCGFPLSNQCGTTETFKATSLVENEGGSLNGFGWQVVLIGYGCGIIFGLIIGYLVFSTRKPEWLVRIVEGEHTKKRRLPKRNHDRRG